MPFAVVGVNHRTAPIEVRERFAFSKREVPAALLKLLEQEGVREAVLLSTCNRTELYMHLIEPNATLVPSERILADHAGSLPEPAKTYLYARRGQDAVRHLYRVTSGLDSMVLGEVQIQGQVRDAYELARGLSGDRQAVRAVFNRLFQSALSVGGRVRTETHLSEGAASVPGAGVELSKKIFGSLSGRRAMVLGAGEMGELTVRTLVSEGMSSPLVASRGHERACRLADELGGQAIPYPRFWDRLLGVDILITSTSAPHAVITREEFVRRMPTKLKKPLLIVDISVPRDVEAEIGELANVFLYTIDDLEQIVQSNYVRRESEIPGAERIVDEGVRDFWRWQAGLTAVPIIKELRQRAESLRQAELERASSQFDELSEADRDRIDRLTRAMFQKLLHEPTSRLRRAAENGRDYDILAAIRYLMGPSEGGEEVESSE